MGRFDGIIGPEEYMEPCCLLSGAPMGQEKPAEPIPVRRVIEKLDEYFERREFDAAERHLKYWMSEAEALGDLRGQFSVHNEMMGFYRKLGREEDALTHAEIALGMLPQIGEESIGAGTCLVNAATVYDAFDMPGRALDLFERARFIYERDLPEGDPRLGGLYNNMALALTAQKRYGEAYELYTRALRVMSGAPNGELEKAITYLNMANAVEAEHGLEKGEEKINQYLELAANLLDTPTLLRNGYYAFVCGKCEPTFRYYGWFAFADELLGKVNGIYEGT